MKFASFHPLFVSPFLLLLAACAGQGAVAAPPPSGSGAVAVDLGGSSRVPHIAGLAGEGEGYGKVQPAMAHASMGAMAEGKPMGKASALKVDHSAMDHHSMQGMSDSKGASAQVAQAAHVQGTGTVNSVDPSGHKINLSHGAIPAIGWPAMTMDFSVAPSVDLRALKPGTPVNFMMERGSDGMYVVHSITPAGGGQ